MDTETILLDVGGTYIKCRDGRQIPISSGGTKDEIAGALRQAIYSSPAIHGEAVDIGVAIPGPFDYRDGTFLMKHKFAAVYGMKFTDLVPLPKGSRVKYIHDVNAVLEGVLRMNDMNGRNVALITIGTGLGFAYAIDGKVQYDSDLAPAKDLYNVPYGDGILEDVVSARGIKAAYRRLTGSTTDSALEIALKAYSGEIAALGVYSGIGETLGEVLPEILAQLEVDTLLMGGQISKSLSLMIRPLANALEGVDILPCPSGAVFEGIKSLFR